MVHHVPVTPYLTVESRAQSGAQPALYRGMEIFLFAFLVSESLDIGFSGFRPALPIPEFGDSSKRAGTTNALTHDK
jgi:hypothetical protein